MRQSSRALSRPIARPAAAALVIVPLLAGLALAGSTGASAAPSGGSTTLIVRDLPAQVRLVPGEKVKIVLSTNRTTGYSWHADGGCCTASDQKVARVSKGAYTAPDSTTGMVGVAGTTTWTVTALRPGTTDVVVSTLPPGAKNTMSAEDVGTLHVIVSAK